MTVESMWPLASVCLVKMRRLEHRECDGRSFIHRDVLHWDTAANGTDKNPMSRQDLPWGFNSLAESLMEGTRKGPGTPLCPAELCPRRGLIYPKRSRGLGSAGTSASLCSRPFGSRAKSSSGGQPRVLWPSPLSSGRK